MMLRKKFEEGSNYRVILDVCGYKEEKNKKIGFRRDADLRS